LCAEKRRPGRPRLYTSEAERKRVERARAKVIGCKVVVLSLPGEYKILLDRFCAENNMSKVEGVCYLLDLHYDFSDPTTHPTNVT
jgi:hypothetical protein